MSKNTLLSNLINYVSANSSGNVVVAAPSSGYALDVTGTGRFTGALTGTSATFTENQNATTTTVFQNTNTANSSSRQKLNIVAGNIGLSLQAIYGDHVYINPLTAVNTYIGHNNLMVLTSGGNVGIGTTSPTSIFHVNTSSQLRARLYSSSAASFLDIENAGNSFYVGVDNSSGTEFGGGAYARTLYGTGAYPMNFYTNGSERMRITSSGNVGIGTTAPTNYSGRSALAINGSTSGGLLEFQYAGTRTAYMYAGSGELQIQTTSDITSSTILNLNSNGSSGILTLQTSGTERMRITSGGNVLIGTTTDSGYPLIVGKTREGGWQSVFINTATAGTSQVFLSHGDGYGAYIDSGTGGSSSARYIFKAVSGGSERFVVRGDGMFYMPGIYNNTNSNAANVWVNSDGSMYRSTSSIKYKKNVQNYSKGLTELMQMRPVMYEGKCAIDEGKIFAGLIAEEIHDLGLTEFVQYAEDGTPDALAYSNMVSLLVKGIQELKSELDTLKNK